jgi:hypothetical protein
LQARRNSWQDEAETKAQIEKTRFLRNGGTYGWAVAVVFKVPSRHPLASVRTSSQQPRPLVVVSFGDEDAIQIVYGRQQWWQRQRHDRCRRQIRGTQLLILAAINFSVEWWRTGVITSAWVSVIVGEYYCFHYAYTWANTYECAYKSGVGTIAR